MIAFVTWGKYLELRSFFNYRSYRLLNDLRLCFLFRHNNLFCNYIALFRYSYLILCYRQLDGFTLFRNFNIRHWEFCDNDLLLLSAFLFLRSLVNGSGGRFNILVGFLSLSYF